MIFDLRAGTRFAHVAQMIKHEREQGVCACGDIHIYRIERGLNILLLPQRMAARIVRAAFTSAIKASSARANFCWRASLLIRAMAQHSFFSYAG
jgi:hypothetical protein